MKYVTVNVKRENAHWLFQFFLLNYKNIINEWTQKKWNRIKETKQKERVIVLILESACLTSWLHDGSLFLGPKVVSCPYLSPVKKWNKTKVLRNFQDLLFLSFHFGEITYKKSGLGGSLFGFRSNWAEVRV